MNRCKMGSITISRQMGSLGCDIAHQVGELLGYRVVWREAINQAAKRAGAPEMALATIDELGLLGIRPSPETKEAYRQALAAVLHELVEGGNTVIIGRASQVILKDRIDVFHVRIIAPAQLRVERVAARHHVSIEAAKEQILASDQGRREFLEENFQVHWDDPELYHLVINTGKLDTAAAAQIILKAYQVFQR